MPVLRPGEVVQSERGDGRWQVERKIGEGQFSEVYSVVEQNTQVQRAVKIEKRTDVRTVRQEYKVLRRLQAGCPQAVRVHEGGEYAGGRFFMVMDLLGPNLTSARRGALGGTLELTAAKVVAASMLKALEQVHAEGYIHRDVKPANFVMEPADAPDPASAVWTLVDFGLARQYVDEASRQPLPPRPEAAFRGSTTYASVNCHRLEDQSRRDDLWGWFYCLVELIEGTLPWRSDREAAVPAATNTATLGGGGADSQLALLPSPPQDGSQAAPAASQQQQAGAAGGGAAGLSKEQVLQRKLECLEQPQLLVTSIPCPQAIVDLSDYLRGLSFEDAPNHPYLRSLLGKLDGPAADSPSWPQSGDMGAAAALAATQQPSGTAEVAPGSSAGQPAAAAAAAAGGAAAEPAEVSEPNGRHQQHGTPAGWEAGRGGSMRASSRPASRASSPRGGATAGPAADRRQSRLGRQDEVQQQHHYQEQQQQQGMAPPAAGKEQRADQKGEQRQQGQGAAAPLSTQRSRDRSRERGRGEERGGRRRSDSPARDRSSSSRSYSRSSSRSRSRGSSSRSRSRSRGRERGRRSRSSSRSRSRDRDRDRRGRGHSRERRRSRSRDRDSRRSRSRSRARERERDRERARDREREQERARARRRSRSSDRYARRSDAPARRRSRSRSPYAGSSRPQQRRGSGSNAKEAPPAAAAPPAQEAEQAPGEGAGGRAAAQQAPAGAAAAGAAEPAAVPQYTTDMHAKYRAGLELVFALRQGGLSEAGAAACRQLRSLEPAEAAGVVCWLLDELATGAEQRHLPAVGAFCEEVAAFALGTAKRCSERSRQR